MKYHSVGRASARLATMLLLALLPALLAACGTQSSTTNDTAEARTVRVGYQKGGSLTLLKAQGTLEQRLSTLGVGVTWTEFPAGPPLLEALNAGSIDIGSAGDTPPIFAQAAGTKLVYVASQISSPTGSAVLVPKDSAITSIADLKGKKVAFTRGSSANRFIIQALEEAGLQFSDIEAVNLTPPDARPAFEGGSVDAWVIWDPYLTIAQRALDARVLRDGTGLPPSRGYYLAAQPFVQQHEDLLKITLDEIQKIETWANSRPDEVASILAPELGIDRDIIDIVVRKQLRGIEPLTEEIVTEQQRVADLFWQLELIPQQISIRENVWYWDGAGV